MHLSCRISLSLMLSQKILLRAKNQKTKKKKMVETERKSQLRKKKRLLKRDSSGNSLVRASTISFLRSSALLFISKK